MITLLFDTWMTALLLIGGLLVICLWIIYNKRESKWENWSSGPDTNGLQQCEYCTHLFYNYRRDATVKCPKCHSFLNPDPDHENTEKTE